LRRSVAAQRDYDERMTFARRLIDLNIRLSRATARLLNLPTDKVLWERFQQATEDQLRRLPDGGTLVDLGAGRRCIYAGALRSSLEFVAIDVSGDELALNDHADVRIVANASEQIPLPNASVGLLVSRAVLEHVPDLAAAVREMARVIQPGGHTIHLFPCRYSLFAIVARTLPFKPVVSLLHRVVPSTIDQVEFEVFYDRGWPAEVERTFRAAGFRDVAVELTWAQPGYFEPVYPLFLVYSLYEFVVRRARVRRLAAYMLVHAER